MHVKPKANLLSLSSYEEIIEAVGGIGMRNVIAYIKATENKISSSALPSCHYHNYQLTHGQIVVLPSWLDQ